MTSSFIQPFFVLQEFKLLISIKLTIEPRKEAGLANLEEKSLERMEALLAHSTMGVHVLFDNNAIASALKEGSDDADFQNVDKMKQVQDVMTELIAKKTYFEKLSFLNGLDKDTYNMVIRAYFHIVENTVRAAKSSLH